MASHLHAFFTTRCYASAVYVANLLRCWDNFHCVSKTATLMLHTITSMHINRPVIAERVCFRMMIHFPTSPNYSTRGNLERQKLHFLFTVLTGSASCSCCSISSILPTYNLYSLAVLLHKSCTVIICIHLWAAGAIAVEEINFCTAAAELCCMHHVPCTHARAVLLKENNNNNKQISIVP